MKNTRTTPDPGKLIEIAGLEYPLIGLYDVAEKEPFAPLTQPARCLFSAWDGWLRGESVCLSADDPDYSSACQGGGYWIGGCMPEWISGEARRGKDAEEVFGKRLNEREGFKARDEMMVRWVRDLKPYIPEHRYVIIGPLRDEQYASLRSVTFYVNPDQLSFLIHGAEYNNANAFDSPVRMAFGSGCGQLAALLGDLDSEKPRALIGATDMAMREHLPPDILAFTVNRAMYEQLCSLDNQSFMYKHFWKRLKDSREKQALPKV